MKALSLSVRKRLQLVLLGLMAASTATADWRPPGPPIHEQMILALLRGEVPAVATQFPVKPTGSYGDARTVIASLNAMLAELGSLSQVQSVEALPTVNFATLRIQALGKRVERLRRVSLVGVHSQRFGKVYFRLAEPMDYGAVKLEWMELLIPAQSPGSAEQARLLIAAASQAQAAAMAHPSFELADIKSKRP